MVNAPIEFLSPMSSEFAEGEHDDLILWMLSLTPTQRLEVAQGVVDSIVAVRNGRHQEVLPMLYRTLRLKQTSPGEK